MTDLERIEAKLDRLMAHMGIGAIPPRHTQSTASAGGEIASDEDMNGPYGDPVIERKDPPKWTGESYVGRHFSECSPEYLESLAGFKSWSAKRDDEANAVDAKGRPKSYWARKDAALARGWAARIRAQQGGQRPGVVPPVGAGDSWDGPAEDQIPF